MRLFGQTLTAAMAMGLALMVAPACVDNDQSIYIRQVMAPPLTRTNGVCSYTPDPTQPFLAGGTFDVALAGGYGITALVGNEMVQRADSNAPRAETNKAHINGAIVRVTDANGGTISEFTSPGSGFVDAANGNVASYGLFGFTGIDAPTAAALRSTLPNISDARLIIVNIKVFGETLGGVDLESAEFQFPVSVCNGCLISFAGADDPLTKDVLDCNLNTSAAGSSSAGSTQIQAPCILGQDEIVPCTLCKGKVTACNEFHPGTRNP